MAGRVSGRVLTVHMDHSSTYLLMLAVRVGHQKDFCTSPVGCLVAGAWERGGAHIRDPGRFIWTRGTPVTTLAAIKAKLQLGSSLVLIRPGCLGSRELGEEGSLSVNKAVQVALLEC
ncbi:uncharacterized [Tachysurus ichikawai]